MKIGLVGYAGSGKSFICDVMKRRFGCFVIKSDEIGHKAYEDKEISEKVWQLFKTLDRKELAQIVFTNKDKLKMLEDIIHPWAIKEIERLITAEENVVLESAILFKFGLERFVDQVWFVNTPFDIRLERVQKRGWSREDLINRDAAIGEISPKYDKKIHRVIFPNMALDF